MFHQLDEYQKSDPKKYMYVVKKIRDGTFDKKMPCDSDSVSPDDWENHFSNLLGQNIEKTQLHATYEKFIEENIDKSNAIFEQPLTKKEVLDAIKSLKNNKSVSFDLVLNEMIKASMPTLLDPIFEVFSTVKYWKVDILSPIHKKNEKMILEITGGLLSQAILENCSILSKKQVADVL